MLSRRDVLRCASLPALFAFPVRSEAVTSDPWSPAQLIEPALLAEAIRGSTPPPILCVGFPVLYRQRHIARALLAGPAGKPDGIVRLKEALTKISKDTPLVIYCGCCPMPQCPNLRPAFSLLSQSGFAHFRVLNLPANFHTDWAAKGYPVESSLPAK